MSKYYSLPQRPARRASSIHPVWRTIGCFTMILVPLFSYALAKVLVDIGLQTGWPIPAVLLGNPRLPDFLYDVPALYWLVGRIGSWTHLYAYLAVAGLLTLLIGGIMSFVYSVVYAAMGPPRWGPLDVPPPTDIKSKSYKR